MRHWETRAPSSVRSQDRLCYKVLTVGIVFPNIKQRAINHFDDLSSLIAASPLGAVWTITGQV